MSSSKWKNPLYSVFPPLRSAPLVAGISAITGERPSRLSACSRWAALTGPGWSNASTSCAWICATATSKCTGTWRARWRIWHCWEPEQEEITPSSFRSSSLRPPPRRQQAGSRRGGRHQRMAGTGVRRLMWAQHHQGTRPLPAQDTGLPYKSHTYPLIKHFSLHYITVISLKMDMDVNLTGAWRQTVQL